MGMVTGARHRWINLHLRLYRSIQYKRWRVTIAQFVSMTLQKTQRRQNVVIYFTHLALKNGSVLNQPVRPVVSQTVNLRLGSSRMKSNTTTMTLFSIILNTQKAVQSTLKKWTTTWMRVTRSRRIVNIASICFIKCIKYS
jgi:hypothetical protein